MKIAEKSFYYLLFCSFLLSCQNGNKDVLYEKKEYTLLDNEIITSMPGSLTTTDDFLVWTDPFARDYFVHVHDKETGRKIGVMGKVGDGPQEFITGGIDGGVVNNCFFATDANGKTRGFLSLDSLVMGKETFIPLSDSERLSRPEMDEYVKDLYIGTTEDGEKTYFKTNIQGHTSFFGNYPIPEVRQHIGGAKAYNKEKGLFAFTSFRFPYLALYQKTGNILTFCGN